MIQKQAFDSSIVLVVQGGAGDVLAATSMIRSMRNTYPRDRLIVLATHPYILAHNPNIDVLLEYNPQANSDTDYRFLFDEFVYGKQPLRFFKQHFPYDGFLDIPFQRAKTLPEAICNLYDCPYDGKPLDYVITPGERCAAQAFMTQFDKPLVLLHLTGILPLKNLNFDIVRTLVNKFKDKYCFAQIGSQKDENIKDENIINMLGMPIRDTISIIPHMKTGIFIESIFAHCTNALNKSAVVVFNATSKEFFGYENNFNTSNSGGCTEHPCNRPIGTLNRFLPAYLNVKTGEPIQWRCPNMVCNKITAEQLEEVFVLSVTEEKKFGPFNSLEEARNA